MRMRWANGMKLARITAALGYLLCAGCLGGYVYPSATYIPRVPVGKSSSDEIHAFRFDIIDYSGSIDLASNDEYLMRELPLSVHGDVSPQFTVGLGRGWWGVYHTLGYAQRRHPTIRVRLYRPGFETVQISPWQWRSKVEWKPAPTLDAQEKAVDDLISTVETNDLYKLNPAVWNKQRVDYNLVPPETPAQREALLFVASEYDRLADAPLFHTAETTARLREKAQQIRDLAKQEN